MNSSISLQFTNKDNIQMLWEVIGDTNMCKNKQPNQIEQLQKHFLTAVKQFNNQLDNTQLSNTQLNISIFELNKKFIEVFLHEFKIQGNNSQGNNSLPPLKLNKPVNNELYT